MTMNGRSSKTLAPRNSVGTGPHERGTETTAKSSYGECEGVEGMTTSNRVSMFGELGFVETRLNFSTD